MRPTTRGVAALATIVLGIVFAHYGGRRALNAIVAPLVVAGVAAVLVVSVTARPGLRRRPVKPGYVGETRSVSFVLEAGRGTIITAVDEVGSGLVSSTNRIESVVSETSTLAYEVSLRSRGVRSVGPLTVTVRDVFGLVERRFQYDSTEPVVVYPPVYELTPTARSTLEGYVTDAYEFERAMFDHLREYERGDSLRDVHWKSAAKRPGGDLVVKEFVAEDGLDRLTLVGTCEDGDPDELAAALATLVDHLFELGVGVVLWLPDDRRIEATPTDRDVVFRALAEFEGGVVSTDHRESADVVVEATDDAVDVGFGGRTIPFIDLCVIESDDETARHDTAIQGEPTAGGGEYA